jgi:hypothetical protein
MDAEELEMKERTSMMRMEYSISKGGMEDDECG